MTENQDSKDFDSGGKSYLSKTVKDKKVKAHRPFTKIIIRRLPPSMTEESFLEQVSPFPEHDYIYFAKPDTSLGNNIYSRAYINFVNVDDIYLFRDKFDGYVFLDDKGVEYVGIVEYAPFQRIPKKKKKKDPKSGTIESDPVYQEFLGSLNREAELENQPKLEYSYPSLDSNDKKVQSTPLLEYLAARRLDKRGRDERRRRENDRRKMRIERKGKDMSIKEEEGGDVEVKKNKPKEWDKNKDETKNYKEQRKSGYNAVYKKKIEDEDNEDPEANKIDERERNKESPRDQKSKKYSDTKKERFKSDITKSDKQSAISKFMSGEGKHKINHDDIKPFTQLPQVKTHDLTKLIEDMDKKAKLDEASLKLQDSPEDYDSNTNKVMNKLRSNSLESEDKAKADAYFARQNSFEDRSKSTDREGSEEKEKSECVDRRTERRIRNKDRPSLVIYQPGMGKFSKQRLVKEKDPQSVICTENKEDT